MKALRRGCAALDTPPPSDGRCDTSGSPRLVRHGELEHLSIAHVDCDALYATVEKRDRPELAERPVIIGGGARRGARLLLRGAALWRALRHADVHGSNYATGSERLR